MHYSSDSSGCRVCWTPHKTNPKKLKKTNKKKSLHASRLLQLFAAKLALLDVEGVPCTPEQLTNGVEAAVLAAEQALPAPRCEHSAVGSLQGDTFSISALHLAIKVPYFSNSGHKNEKVTALTRRQSCAIAAFRMNCGAGCGRHRQTLPPAPSG